MPVDRTRAATRAAWLLTLGGLLAVAGAAAGRGIRWKAMWSADPVTLAAMSFLLFVLLVVALLLLARGGRWLALALWPRATDVSISADGIALALGPFGTQALDWSRMRMEWPEREEEIPAMDDDPVLPRLHHPAFSGEICERVMQFCGVTPVELFGVLSPHVDRIRAQVLE